MATLWSAFRQEVMGTVDDFRQKGVVAAFKDVALDAADLAAGAVVAVVEGVESLVGEENDEEFMSVVRLEALPVQGAAVAVEHPDGTVSDGLIIAVDSVSNPPRVRVALVAEGETRTVLVLPPGVPVAAEPLNPQRTSLVDVFTDEVGATVQEFREKGAVGAFKDATLDVVDLVSDTAKTVGTGAAAFAAPLIDLDLDTPEESCGVSEPASSSSTSPPPKGTLGSFRDEVGATVQDIRDSGAVDALKGATMGAVDLVSCTAQSITTNAMSTAETLRSGAKSLIDDLGVPVAGEERGEVGGLRTVIESLKQEVDGTAQDFREKGAIGTFKDAALDCADLATGAAKEVAKSARSIADPILEQASVRDFLYGGSCDFSAHPTGTTAPSSSPQQPNQLQPIFGCGLDEATGPCEGGTASSSADTNANEVLAGSKSECKKSLVQMRRNMFEKQKEEMLD